MPELTLRDLIPHLELFDELELDIWIDGGWGVDALLGEQTRPHADLDFLIEKADSKRLLVAIRELGFVEVHTDDRTDWNFVMGSPDGKNFDFHVLVRKAGGNYEYGPPANPVIVTAESIAGTGTIGGNTVRCPSAKFLIDSHTGYGLKESDIRYVTALSEKFGVPLHPEQLEYLARHDRE